MDEHLDVGLESVDLEWVLDGFHESGALEGAAEQHVELYAVLVIRDGREENEYEDFLENLQNGHYD